MKWAVLLTVAITLVAAPFAPASVPAGGCKEKCCAESHNCCADACPCPVSCVLPASAAATAPVVAQIPAVISTPRPIAPPADEWATALPQRPPVPPPRA